MFEGMSYILILAIADPHGKYWRFGYFSINNRTFESSL